MVLVQVVVRAQRWNGVCSRLPDLSTDTLQALPCLVYLLSTARLLSWQLSTLQKQRFPLANFAGDFYWWEYLLNGLLRDANEADVSDS